MNYKDEAVNAAVCYITILKVCIIHTFFFTRHLKKRSNEKLINEM